MNPLRSVVRLRDLTPFAGCVTRRLPRAALLAALVALAGCSADAVQGEFRCPEGEVINNGVCVPEGRGGSDTRGGDPTDVTTPDAGTDTVTPDGSGESDVEVDADAGGCTPGQTGCVDATIAWTCEDGVQVPSACAEGEFCQEGACVGAEEVCTPGEIVGCEDANSQRVCDESGEGFSAQACPEAAPNCLGDGFCDPRICLPPARICDGNDVLVCAEDGSEFSMIQTCLFGCQNGGCVDPCATSGKDYIGCTFYAVDLPNLGEAADTPFAVTISNSFDAEVTATVTRPDGTQQTATVPPRSLEIVSLGVESQTETSLNNRSIRIDTNAPVTMHQFNPLNEPGVATNDASLILPSTSVGQQYLVTAWTTQGDGRSGVRGYATVIAVFDTAETNVRIVAPSTGGIEAGGGVPAIPAGATETITMTQGQVLNLMTAYTDGADITGMEITADAPIAVFAGNECANVPTNSNFCDHIEQQLTSTDTWSTNFVLAKFNARGTEPDVYRIVGRESGTTLSMSPPNPLVHNRTIGRGETIQFEETRDFSITATAPISVSQFMVGSSYPGPELGCDRISLFGDQSRCAIAPTCSGVSGIGDPAFLWNVPTDQFLSNYIVLTPSQYIEDYLSLIVPSGAEVRLDGAVLSAARTRLGEWDIIRTEVRDGVHRVDADVAFGLYAYGYDCDVSYAYPGGLNLETL